MKILAFSDLRTTEELPDESVELVALLGHIPSKMVSKIDKKYNCIKVGLLSERCHPTLYDNTSIMNLHGNMIEIKGINIAGFGGVPSKNEEDAVGCYKEGEVDYFVKQLAVSNVHVLLSYSNLAYGDKQIKSPIARNGYSSYNNIILNKIVDKIIHGRLQEPFIRQYGEVTIHSVYPYSIIEI